MIKQLNINKMKNLNNKTMKNVMSILLMFFFTCFFLLTACEQGQTEQKEKPAKTYKDYTYEEFEKLPHDVQYALKFPDDVDTIITVEYGWVDTTFNEDGTPLKIDFCHRICNLVLEKDTMKLYYPYNANPTFSFWTNKKLYSKQSDSFSDRFKIEFLKNRNSGFYYITKSEFPSLLCSDNRYENGLDGKPYVDNLEPTEKKYKDLVKEVVYHYKHSTFISDPYSYRLQQSYDLPKDMVSKGVNTWVVEENEVSKFQNWLQR